MNLRRSSILPLLVCLSAVVGLAAARWGHLGLLEGLEWVTYDLRVRSAASRPAPCAENLGYVFIDDATIREVHGGLLGAPYGLYWPRHVYGRLLQELQEEGAKAIAFDVLFPDLRPDLGGILRPDGSFVEGDDFLAEQMARGGNVLLAAESGLMPPDLFRTNAAMLCDITTDKDEDGKLRRTRAFQTYTNWHPAFRSVEADPELGINLAWADVQSERIVLPRSAGLEAVEVPLDEEGHFDLRDFYGETLPEGMAPMAAPFEVERIWSLGVALAAWGLGADLARTVVDTDHGFIRLHGPGGDRTIPVDSEGRFYVDWSLPLNDSRLAQEPAVNLLRRHLERASGADLSERSPWKGKLVVIGSSAVGNDLNDFGATPLEKHTFLVSKHWNVANSILTGRFIRRGSATEEILGTALLSALVALITLRLRPLLALAATMLALASYVAVTFMIFSAQRLWLPVALPILGVGSVYLLLTTWRVFFEQSERKRVRSVFSKVVSPKVVSELLDAQELALGGARREISVFFADVRGFTELTDHAQQVVADEVARRGLGEQEARGLFDRQAKDTLDTVNIYLARVADVIKAHHGTLDKYIGDCVMAFWGAPTPNPQHALNCVRAAIDAQRAIAAINEERAAANASRADGEPGMPVLSLGTGINTGLAVVGLMGSDAHILNYTVFGREVNVASRLEGVSGRGRIIISAATHQHLLRDDAALAARCVPLPAVSVKGIRDAVRIYEVPWRAPNEGCAEPAQAVTSGAA